MDGLFLAFGFLTVIPMPYLTARPGGLGRAAMLFPLVGMIIGAVVAGVVQGSTRLWHDPWVAASFALLVNLVLTGGLHIDGFMDTADAFFSHRDRERMLEIMRDSRAGALGVASGGVLLLAKFAAINLLITEGLRATWLALVLAPLLGRTSIVLASKLFPQARTSGLGASFAGEVRGFHVVLALVFAGVMTVVLANWQGVALLGMAIVLTLLGGAYWTRRVGGLTGDIFGAVNESVELAVLLIAAILLR